MIKKPMTKIQFMTTTGRRLKKRVAAIEALNIDDLKKMGGAGFLEVTIQGRPKFRVAVNPSTRGRRGIALDTKKTAEDKIGTVLGYQYCLAGAPMAGNPNTRFPKTKTPQYAASITEPPNLKGDLIVDPDPLGNDTAKHD